MKRNCMQDRTKAFAVRIIKDFRDCKDEAVRVTGRQFPPFGNFSRCNYRAACRARSAADFISKVFISVVVEENPMKRSSGSNCWVRG